MKNLKIYRNTEGSIIIDIPTKSIMDLLENEDIKDNFGLLSVKDDTDMIKYVIEKMKEKIEIGEKLELSPVDKMIIDILHEASFNFEEFMDFDEEYE